MNSPNAIDDAYESPDFADDETPAVGSDCYEAVSDHLMQSDETNQDARVVPSTYMQTCSVLLELSISAFNYVLHKPHQLLLFFKKNSL